MNLLVGIAVLLCLGASEIPSEGMPDRIWQRLAWAAIIGFSIPGVAWVQTLIMTQKIRTGRQAWETLDASLRNLFWAHGLVWLAANLAIVYALRWPDIVRLHWQLDSWPVLDEVIILMPLMLSLVASWAVFYSLQNALDRRQAPVHFWRGWLNRIRFVSLRVRVHSLLVLVPVAMAILVRDLLPTLEQQSVPVQLGAYGLMGLLVAVVAPFMLMMVWKTTKLTDSLGQWLEGCCEELQLKIWSVRIWQTNSQIINALVIGLLPRLRVILLSDTLVEEFPRNELKAVVRHEAGHIQLGHLPIRMAAILLPLVALAVDEQNAIGATAGLKQVLLAGGIPVWWGLVVLCTLYFVYLFTVLAWLSHNMELEADLYACRNFEGDGPAFCSEATQNMSDALLRLAAFNPQQWTKRSLFHPSLESRVFSLRELAEDSCKADQFAVTFRRRKRLVLGLLAAICWLTFCV